MREWKYSLGSAGKLLRERIKAGESRKDSIRTLEQLVVCCKQCAKMLEDSFESIKFEDVMEYTKGDIGLLRIEDEDERNMRLQDVIGSTDIHKVVNNELAIFYDLCDFNNIWIPV